MREYWSVWFLSQRKPVLWKQQFSINFDHTSVESRNPQERCIKKTNRLTSELSKEVHISMQNKTTNHLISHSNYLRNNSMASDVECYTIFSLYPGGCILTISLSKHLILDISPIYGEPNSVSINISGMSWGFRRLNCFRSGFYDGVMQFLNDCTLI